MSFGLRDDINDLKLTTMLELYTTFPLTQWDLKCSVAEFWTGI